MKEKKAAGKHKKRFPLTLVVVLLLIAVVGFQLFQVHGQISDGHAESETLSMEASRKTKENQALQEDLDRADDPAFWDELAREKLGLAEQGERIFYDVNH